LVLRQLPDAMPWQIYQIYMCGPNARFCLFEEAFGGLALYRPPDMDEQQMIIDTLSHHISILLISLVSLN
jgi:hypothetical protein